MRRKPYKIGDPVVYRTTKLSTSPGPRAEEVDAAPKGDLYSYKVDKYWVVNGIDPEGRLQLRTRRGKTHVLAPDDERLRHATLLERMFKAGRFPSVAQPGSTPPAPASQTN